VYQYSPLMYLRVYDSRDNSHQSEPSPSLYYSITHAHWSTCYLNHNPQLLAELSTRLMYLRVYDSRDNSRQSVPSPSLCYSITNVHRSIGWVAQGELLNLQKKGQFPDESVKINSLMNSLCNLPDVLGITDIKETALGGLLL
jgi:hypothetical protein